MQDPIPLEHRQLAVLRIESHQLSGYPKIIPALNFFSMKNVAAEVFCSTATSKCTKMEKRLDSLLKNNYHQRRKIAGNCFNCLSTSFLPSTADAARAPPSQCPHTCKQTSRYSTWLCSHHTSLYWGQYRYFYILHMYYLYTTYRVI